MNLNGVVVCLFSLLVLFASFVVVVVFVSCGVFTVNQLLINLVLISCERYHHMQMMSSQRISYLIHTVKERLFTNRRHAQIQTQ